MPFKPSSLTMATVLIRLRFPVCLQFGDFIMTGTPAGVGVIRRDDKLKGYIESVCSLKFAVI